MSRAATILLRTALVALLVSVAQSTLAAQETDTAWDVTSARGETRVIDFTTEEGTFMSVDFSPDGRWIAFDLLAHVYRVPVDGGTAEPLTQESGVALNYHPRYSPDGSRIAFVSDRGGQNNLWVMNADGSDPRPVFQDLSIRVLEPAWTPDGQYILVRRQNLAPGQEGGGIWMYHVDGGDGVELIGSDVTGAAWPSPSSDGKYVYFHKSTPGQTVSWAARDAIQGAYQVRRLDLRTGTITAVTAGQPTRQIRQSSGGAYAPEVSPDGRWLAFARRIPDGRISFKGHEFGPRTALWLRDLATGAERVVMDPIEVDMIEGMKTLRVLAGYSWAADGESIVISQGGKLRRLHVESERVETIPFTARVRRTISEQAYKPFRITDDQFTVKFTRWQTATPDGRRLAFQAVGRIWIMDLPNGTPHRLTAPGFEPFEYAPAWSPDGRWIAFTSWDDAEGGHLWKIAATGGEPERLTVVPGEYVHPDWSHDGSEIVVARGSGASFRSSTMVHNPWYDIVVVPASGGEAEVVTKAIFPEGYNFFTASRTQIVRPVFGFDGRIFYFEVTSLADARDSRAQRTTLVSVRRDGGDRLEHLTFPYADEVVPSPDGKWVAFNEGDNIYVVPLPAGGSGREAVHVDRKNPKLPVKQLSNEGGLFPRWRNASTVEFGSGPRYFAHHLDAEETDTVDIRLSIPRDQARGTVALRGARLVTLENREVIESGTLLVRDGRITCVGECDTAGADRVVDLQGKTIIPGFIDMHSHFFREYRGIIPQHPFETAVALAYGVTTNVDNSMWSQDVFPTAELIEAGMIVGPRTFSTGDPLYSGDRWRNNDLTSYEVAEHNVNRLASWGAVSLKQYMQPRRDQRQWVSHAARKRGLMVTAEGGDLAYNVSMIMDGQTGWEHPMSYTPLYSDAARFFGQAKAVYSATLVVGGPGPWNDEFFLAEADLWKDDKLRRWFPWKELAPHLRRRMLRPKSDYSFPILAQGMADIIAEGGYGAIGAHGQQHGLASHWEVWILESALGPMGALEVASRHGAYFLGAEQDLGSISAGKLADVIVLNSNPLDDIRNTTDIAYVMKGGRLYDGDTLDEIWPEQKPYGVRPWVDADALRNDVRPIDYWDQVKSSSKR